MLEIFIPTKIKKSLDLNNISEDLVSLIRKSFPEACISKFESSFFEWFSIKSDVFLEDLIRLSNWEFGEFYFISFDYLKHSFYFSWTKMLWENKIYEKIELIDDDIKSIIDILKSNNLLTNSKKQEIKEKIKKSLFVFSWIIFLLYSLLENTKNNIDKLESYDWLAEYEWQATLLTETSKTKKIELEASISKMEWKLEFFIDSISKLIK